MLSSKFSLNGMVSMNGWQVCVLTPLVPILEYIQKLIQSHNKHSTSIMPTSHTVKYSFICSVWFRAVRRRTGGRRRRWVVLWSAAAARRAFFIGGDGVALWSAAAASVASDRMREHWNSALAGQASFSGFTRGQPLHLWSLLGRWRRKVNCEYACYAQFHSLND